MLILPAITELLQSFFRRILLWFIIPSRPRYGYKHPHPTFRKEHRYSTRKAEWLKAEIIRLKAHTADAMVTRFTADLWKIAQDGGITLNDDAGWANLHNISNALIAFAMQFYYEDTANATNANKQLFTDLTAANEGSNGIRFDMHDVSKDIAAAMDANASVDLAAKQNGKYVLKGYEYFMTYIDTSLLLSSQERGLIKSMLPFLRDWYIQAGTSGMIAADTQNRGAFMLGGNGGDALTGGTAADLLVGNAGDDMLRGGGGNDLLLGGSGNDAYVYTSGDGLDTVVDSDGNGSIAMDGDLVTGGAQYGDERVHRDANGHFYTDVGSAGGSVYGTVIDGGNLIDTGINQQGDWLSGGDGEDDPSRWRTHAAIINSKAANYEAGHAWGIAA